MKIWKEMLKYTAGAVVGFGLCFAAMAYSLGHGIDVKLPTGEQVTCYNFGERWK